MREIFRGESIPRDEDEPTRALQLAVERTIRFAQPAFGSSPGYRVANLLARDESDGILSNHFGLGCFGSIGIDDAESTHRLGTLLVDEFELATIAQGAPHHGTFPKKDGGESIPYPRVAEDGQALSFLRPLVRRRFKIVRPLLVELRLRKPWSRLRLMLLG